MARIIAINSFRRGTGKSNLAANIATLQAASGQNTALIDMDLASPSQQTLFGVSDPDIQFTFNDFLWGNCEIEQAALDLTPRLARRTPLAGTLQLVPASQRLNEIARVLRGDYYSHLLDAAFEQLVESLKLDTLIIDTHAGLNEETLMVFGLCDTALIILRSDMLDYQGTAVTLDIAKQLEISRTSLVVNQLPPTMDPAAMVAHAQEKYQHDVLAALPYTNELAALASQELFVLRYPEHPLTQSLKTIAEQLAG
jgi:MinD-like ATPase involved in chromosome partitioning or flagellar assembly